MRSSSSPPHSSFINYGKYFEWPFIIYRKFAEIWWQPWIPIDGSHVYPACGSSKWFHIGKFLFHLINKIQQCVCALSNFNVQQCVCASSNFNVHPFASLTMPTNAPLLFSENLFLVETICSLLNLCINVTLICS
mgnify:CR=1 FL=1